MLLLLLPLLLLLRQGYRVPDRLALLLGPPGHGGLVVLLLGRQGHHGGGERCGLLAAR
jgi:hypothetical protein